MRQLKFRAWDGEKMISPDYISRNGLAYWYENSVIETSDKVMQFTGLKDKNGKEIYEGDLVAYDLHYSSGKLINLTVKWDENNCFYRGYYEEGMGHSLNNFISSHYEIIGNIYENPDLIK